MADSNITKKALASALKSLMQEKAFEKISVSDICEKCDMNRKSFYYHFKDKYDLLNWIFDTEFIAVTKNIELDATWNFMLIICKYFEENRAFYRKALKVTGQNSFTEHFHDVIYMMIRKRFQVQYHIEDANDFQMNFFADAAVLTFQRWVIDEMTMSSEEFIENLESCCYYMMKRYEQSKK